MIIVMMMMSVMKTLAILLLGFCINFLIYFFRFYFSSVSSQCTSIENKVKSSDSDSISNENDPPAIALSNTYDEVK